MDQSFEVKLATGQIVTWSGRDGMDACRRYVAAHPGAVAVAWRPADRHGVFPGLLPIVEGGDRPRRA